MSTAVEPQPSWYTQDGDTDYLYQVLRHEVMELKLNDRVAFKYVIGSYLRAAFYGFVGGIVGLIVGYFALGASGMVVLWLVATFAVFLIVYLRSKVNEPLGEWKVLLSDRARSADSAYVTIAGVIARRQLPVEVKARRMVNDVRTRSVANRLIITRDSYTVYVAVFPYGTSLYLSWRMWRRRSGFELLKRFVFDIFGAIFGSTDIIGVMQRTDPPRAMREAIHSACREGLKVAVNATMVPVDYAFPQGMPEIEKYKADAESFNTPLPAPQAAPMPPLPAADGTQYAAPPAAPPQDIPAPRQELPPLEFPGQAGPADPGDGSSPGV